MHQFIRFELCRTTLGALGAVGVLAAAALLGSGAHASIIHVPADHPTLKAAIAAAIGGDEIVVADGTYSGPDNRALDFAGKALLLRSANGPAACIIDCELVDRAFIFQSGETNEAVVDGLTIRNGKPPSGALNGGAILINGIGVVTRPVVRNCVLETSTAPNGGAIAINGISEPAILDCLFVGNTAVPAGVGGFGGAISLSGAAVVATITGCTFESNGSAGGGAIHKSGLSQVTVDRCTFAGNTSSGNGGAASLTSASVATVSNCTFVGNESFGTGGGALLTTSTGSNSTIINCLFSGNQANVSGLGGAVLASTGSITLLNCTMAGNTAGAVNLGGAIAKLTGSTVTVQNCIIWGNAGMQIQSAGAPAIVVEHSIVQGGFGGVGNLATDPLLVDIDGADNIVGTPDDDLRVPVFSPAVDSGSNSAWTVALTEDFAGLPRFYDEPTVVDSGEGIAPIIDRGAYESQPSRPECAPADLDCDGDVDGADLGMLLAAWTG